MVKAQRMHLPLFLMILAVGAILFIILVLFSSPMLSPGTQFTSLEMSSTSIAAGNQAVVAQLEATQRAPAEAQQPAQDRIIIRNATLRIVVSDTEAMLDEIAGLAEEFGGWIVNSNISRVTTPSREEAVRGTINIRVMAERLDEALERIKSGAISVESENVTGQDVTQQYVDLTSRLTNLQAAETQLQSIMEDARRTEDVLSVYNELVRVRGEIEVIQGQIQYYSESAAFSSISVELVPEALETPIQIAGWSPEGTARGAFLALLNVLRFLVDVAITLVVLVLPLVLIVGVPGWLVYRRVRHRRQAASS
jgi:hypothetical protein